MAQIELKNLGKSYGNVEVLSNISLVIEEGEFVVLVGPSGCGKSTLLRMIAGLEDINEGEVLIGGKLANFIPAKQRDLAMVFQSYALYPHMKVADNMSFSLKLARVPKDQISERVQRAAKILGLEDLLERLPRELSGGQRQRVAMGRAIVRDPEAFLFDEPLSNLDAKLRVKMRTEIKSLHKRLGKTMIYVTHDQTEAMTMADTIVVLNDGDIAQSGQPLEIYRNPNSAFVASFIGSPEINLLPVIAAGKGKKYVTLGGGGIELPLPGSLDMSQGSALTYGIRPQHIELTKTGLKAQIVLVEPTGEDQEVVVQLGEHRLSIVVRGQDTLHIGDEINLAPLTDKVLLFDVETGQRLQQV